ncbi:MAG TPA: biotin carboxylase, partial [Vicinamibacteria bacterium]|nr:biotin carboxylase [Vicinamibacteria bacterium]
SWSQLVIKFCEDSVEYVSAAPSTGVWRMEGDGSLSYVRMQTHRRTAESESEAFFLRITRPGDYFYEGADLGILVTPGRLMTDDFRLNDRAKAWVRGIRAQFASRPLEAKETEPARKVAEVGGFKFL